VVQGTFHPKHYFFIQQGSDLTFFPVSWSLAIEEWFYILIPLVFLVNIKLLKLPHLIFIGILMVLITFLRYIYIANSNPEFDLMVRKSIPLRFDALLTGVLFSIVKVNYSDLYKKISGIISLFLSISLFALGFIVYRKYVLLEASVAFGFQKNFFQAIIFIFFSFSFGFLIIWLESAGLNKLKKENLIVRIVTILSILTYAIYLIHYDIFKWMIHSQTFSSSWVKEISISLLVITGLTFLMHWLIEKPLMDYRKTLVKKLFSRNA
jgi:peptidoglycan/LPS O-acetylase OafA/YrhL